MNEKSTIREEAPGAVIMAGGEGTRLRPLTSTRPKPMTELLGKPIAAYAAELLMSHGIRDVRFTTCYLPEQVEGYFASRYSELRSGFFSEDTPLGTAGSVRAAAYDMEGTLVVLSGDALTDVDLTAAISFHREKGACATLVLKAAQDPLEYGIVIIGEDGRIRRFCEKPSRGEVFSDLVNTGIYIIEAELLSRVPEDRPFDFSRDLFPMLLEEGAPLYGYVTDAYWCDVGSPQAYTQAQEDILAGRVRVCIEGRRENGVYLGNGARISPSAVVEAPVFLGSGAAVRPGAYIGAYSAVGADSVVEEGARLKRAMIGNNVYIGRGARISRSIVCRDSAIGDRVRLLEGSVIGDGCYVGDGATVAAGVKLWPEKWIESGAVVEKNVIWGGGRRGDVITLEGVAGRLNTDISAEELTRLGGALAETGRRTLVMACDGSAAARVAVEAAAAGAAASGAAVTYIDSTMLPVLRAAVKELRACGGVYARSGGDGFVMELFESDGMPPGKSAGKALNAAFDRGGFKRVRPEGLRPAYVFTGSESLYGRWLSGSGAAQRLAGSGAEFRIEGGGAAAGGWLARALTAAGARYSQAASLVLSPALNGSVGTVAVNGKTLSEAKTRLLAYMTAFDEMRELGETCAIVPPGIPGRVRELAEARGIELTEANTVCPRGSNVLGEVFYDMAFFGALLMIRLSTDHKYIEKLPELHIADAAVPCERRYMGTVLRELYERYGETCGGCGVRVDSDKGFGFVSPSDTDPVIRISTEGLSEEFARELCGELAAKVNDLINKRPRTKKM